jgi:hypothetical protein
MDHVRLSYCYLDDGDMDAYCSLFAEQAAQTPRTTRRFRHLIHEVFGSGRRVAAIGRRRPAGADDNDGDIPFVDVFTVADNGLLIDRTTFLFAPAARCAGS